LCLKYKEALCLIYNRNIEKFLNDEKAFNDDWKKFSFIYERIIYIKVTKGGERWEKKLRRS